MERKNVFLWSLYDFANSIVMIVFLFYFSQWLVIDTGRPDWWYNATLIISSVLFIITAPIAGHMVDTFGKKLSGLRITTALTFVFYLATALVTLLSPTHVALATLLFTLALYFYLLSFVFYTPMINDIASPNDRGFISGIGQGANYFGQVGGLLVTLPFATGAVYLFGTAGRVQALLPASVLFGLCALPMLLWYNEHDARPRHSQENLAGHYQQLLTKLRKIFAIKNLLFLFLAYFFFSDALLTFSNNFPIFLEKVYGVADAAKTYLTAGILILAGIGAVFFGKIADRRGNVPVLTWILVGWCVLLPLLAFAPSFPFAAVICLLAGLIFGAVWGVSRAMVAEFTPREIEGSSFSFYTIFERFATFIGPITWSVVLAATADKGVLSYRYAIISLAVLLVVSIIFLRKVRPTQGPRSQSAPGQ